MTELLDVLQSVEGSLGYRKDKHMMAFEFRKTGARTLDTFDFVGYFASGALHSPPITLNTMTNVYLCAISRSEGLPDDTRFKVTVRNDPMPKAVVSF